MIDSANLNSLLGATVSDLGGDKIGNVGQIYVDSDTDQATWATVKTGFFGTSETFVPLDKATWGNEQLTVPFEKEFVKNAPRIEADGALSEEEEDALYRYYGNGAATPAGGQRSESEGHDTSGTTTDAAMTRSEEELRVGTRKVETGRAQLRKYVVTEQQSVTVPVSHDEVRLVREPITDANAEDGLDGPEISEEVHEIVLTADEVVVDKTAVPVERVSVGTETVTEQEEVAEEVRKEQIDVVDPTSTKSTHDSRAAE